MPQDSSQDPRPDTWREVHLLRNQDLEAPQTPLWVGCRADKSPVVDRCEKLLYVKTYIGATDRMRQILSERDLGVPCTARGFSATGVTLVNTKDPI